MTMDDDDERRLRDSKCTSRCYSIHDLRFFVAIRPGCVNHGVYAHFPQHSIQRPTVPPVKFAKVNGGVGLREMRVFVPWRGFAVNSAEDARGWLSEL